MSKQVRHDDKDGAEIRFGAGHPNDSLAGKLPDKSTRVEFTFSDESKLFFNDQRKFGWVRADAYGGSTEYRLYAPEVRAGAARCCILLATDLHRAIAERRKNTGMKAALLDQSVIAGIGNIYADESRFGAPRYIRLHWFVTSPAKQIAHALSTELAVCAETWPSKRAAQSDKNYVNAEGKRAQLSELCPRVPARGRALPALRHHYRQDCA